MPTDPGRELLILGILRRGPLSAYSLNAAVRGHAPLYRPLKHGNIYHLLGQLADRGILLRKNAKAQRGPQETKIIYRLSAAGERRFNELLLQILLDIQAPDPTLEIAYVLLGQLPRSKAIELLEQRSQQIVEQERRIAGDVEERSGGGYLGISHNVDRLRSERSFLKDSIARLANVKWKPEWVFDDGPVDDPKRKL